MFKKAFSAAALLGLSCFVVTSQADVVLDFNTTGDTQGFVNDNGNSVAQDAFNSGSLRVDALGGGDFFEAISRSTTLSFTSGSALGIEFTSALANGGTITFDAFAQDGDINGTPGVLEIQLSLESGFSRDTEVVLVSVPSGSTTSNSFNAAIVLGSGSQFNGTNGTINYTDSGTHSISLGFKDGGDNITSGVFYIDNFTVSANTVPEPSSLMALGSIAGLVLVRRKRRVA